MGDLVVERKVHYLGFWQVAMVDNNILNTINSRIGKEKGRKVKLHLSSNGLRAFKKSAINGKALFDCYLPLDNVQFVSVSRQTPDVLVVISVTGDPQYKYQIQAFRCKNGIDSGIFISTFGNIQKSAQTAKVAWKTQTNPTEENRNWTLKNQMQDNSKRELDTFVDVNGERVVARNVTAVPVPTLIVANGHTKGLDNGIRIASQQKPTKVTRDSLSLSEFKDNSSEISESAFRTELEFLSQELRDIKLMLEKSTSTTVANSKPRSKRESTQYYVKSQRNDDDALDVVVADDKPVKLRQKENGYTEANGDATTHVRVLVPDYRAASDHSTVHVIKSSGPEKKNDGALYDHQKTTSYEKLNRNSIERKAIQYNDLPERIQWRTRTSRSASHVVGRQSSTLSTWSTDHPDGAQVQLRHHPVGVGSDYQRVSFGPNTVRVQDRRARGRPLSTTVVKPIEKVYAGRSDAKHHSLSSRRHRSEVRQTILVQDNIANEESNGVFKHGNNALNSDSDEQLLDVSGLDLFKAAPTEGVTIIT